MISDRLLTVIQFNLIVQLKQHFYGVQGVLNQYYLINGSQQSMKMKMY
jgi:hypothetical protein